MTRMSLLTPTLHTARLRLRPFDDTDADDLFVLHSSAYVLRYWPRLRDGGRARFAAVGIRHAGPESRPG